MSFGGWERRFGERFVGVRVSLNEVDVERLKSAAAAFGF
jgi:hypothetical protein